MPLPTATRVLASLLLAAGMAAAGAAHSPRHVTRQKIGQWRLSIARDSFSGGMTCRLTARRLTVDRGLLVVHLPGRVDTMNAVYRLDDGPPILASADDQRLAFAGFTVRADTDPFNASGGLVRIPLDRIATAKQLRIETSSTRLWHVPIAGLGDAMGAWRSAGCH